MKPVWPKLPMGKIMPRGADWPVSMSSRTRAGFAPRSPDSAEQAADPSYSASLRPPRGWHRWPRELPRRVPWLLRSRHQSPELLAPRELARRPASRSSKACAKMPTSCAVENTPACPATPPMRRAVVSCTVPAEQVVKIGVQPASALPSSSRAVGAMRGKESGAPCTGRTGVRRPIRSGAGARRSQFRSSCADRTLSPRKVAGVFHAERVEHLPLDEDVQRLAGDLLNQRAKQNEIDVGVAETLTRTPTPTAW